MKPGKTAVQGLVIPVAYDLGRVCPVGPGETQNFPALRTAGQCASLLAGLERFWPELPRTTEARKAFMQGLEDRFKNLDEQEKTDGEQTKFKPE